MITGGGQFSDRNKTLYELRIRSRNRIVYCQRLKFYVTDPTWFLTTNQELFLIKTV